MTTNENVKTHKMAARIFGVFFLRQGKGNVRLSNSGVHAWVLH